MREGRAEGIVDRGAACLNSGRLSEAEDLLRQAVGALGTAESHLLLANALLLQGRTPEALRTIRDGLRLHPDHAPLHFRLARIGEFQGDAGLMERGFRRFLLLSPGTCGQESLPTAGPCGAIAAGARSRRFQAFMAMDAFDEGFREAELILDAWDPCEADALSSPWEDELCHWRDEGFYRRRLDRLESLTRPGAGRRAPPSSPWPLYFRGMLRLHLGEFREALREFGRLGRFPAGRYGWMGYGAGLAQLFRGNDSQEEAAERFAAALRSKPDAFWCRGRLAEALLCLGREREAFAQFDLARSSQRSADVQAQIRAWRGEALLWLGRCKRAVRELDRAMDGGSQLAVCWRGAARMLLDDPAGAQEDLDRAVRLDPADGEAFLWRGELHRRLGRFPESLADLDKAVALNAGPWARVNRALARAALGDAVGMREDLAGLPSAILGRGRGRSPGDPRGSDAEAAAALEAAVRAARGVRRAEPYLEALWAPIRSRSPFGGGEVLATASMKKKAA
ncbi:MAG: tetratricopeptide repeat protein [Elusimicrobia bacterium]|nr:tetratricopeptide repeat protein [Elusimicrobiota bacterium]